LQHPDYTNADKPDWLSFKATITFIKKDMEGGACASSGEPCKNRCKVTQWTPSGAVAFVCFSIGCSGFSLVACSLSCKGYRRSVFFSLVWVGALASGG
jgi:hypothetical protein